MKKIIILGVAAFVIAMFFKTPASIVTSQFEANSPVSLQGVRGSLWKGSATQVSYNGMNLGEAKWSINPLGFLTGSAKGNFSIEGDKLTANGEYKASLSKTLTLDNTQFQVSSDFINKLQRYTRLTGDFRGTIDHLEMQQNSPLQPPMIAGLLNWEQGGITSPFPLPEGTYQLKLEPDSTDTLIGQISSHDSPVEINGNIWLDKEWSYQTDLKIKSTTRNPTLNNMLSMAGKRQADGSFLIKETGKLPIQ